MERLNIPDGQFRDLGISPTHCYKIRHRKAIPSPALVLKIKALNPDIPIKEIITQDNPIFQICEIYAAENGKNNFAGLDGTD